MKKVIICGSIATSDEIIAAQKELEERGFEVEIPFGCKKYIENGFKHVAEEERAGDKKKHDLIRAYYEKMKEYDIVLVINVEKCGIPITSVATRSSKWALHMCSTSHCMFSTHSPTSHTSQNSKQ